VLVVPNRIRLRVQVVQAHDDPEGHGPLQSVRRVCCVESLGREERLGGVLGSAVVFWIVA
jgi:hypothetical protein